MWPRTLLAELLQIEHPIIQAPMAGSATPALAAAVSNAGALGSLGCGAMPLHELRSAVETLQSATTRPFNLNFFAHATPAVDDELDARMASLFAPYYEELGIQHTFMHARTPFGTFDRDRLEYLLEVRPAVVSFHFGLPDLEMVRALQQSGSIVLSSATTVAEARELEAAGIDAIIAQGWEAGGHRGTFATCFEDAGTGTMALVPQVVDAVDVPVIAAGGIADGRSIAAAFALGASGVQMGTAFLSCPEAQVSAAHRAALKVATDDDTRLTRAFSGRPARAKRTRFIEEMAKHREPFADFPTMYGFSEPLLRHSAETADERFQFLLYGQAAALNRELPAAELVRALAEEAQAVAHFS